ncbi:HD domain-containing protein [Bacillus suaedaesalsae]|uniref:HD domain-containing protein n=1 Tax=Bacillus suaedaesalsae TaxID=2810349 RepID=A0ABS2DJ31_9BACI|nr:HD domain-containing protein [Bacillus suaedaesalsae]MBM6617561.1 HD domain-containing protein [Bacillus suaedaesalsae]
MRELQQKIDFLREVDKLKQVYRRSFLMDGTRNENDAEHTWHISLMAVILIEYAEENIDLLKVIQMLLIHDIVEIDAGDTFAYDEIGYLDKEEREQEAADRIFGLLPESQKDRMIELWSEFEEQESNEAKYASALDRMQPLLQNFYSKGSSWRPHGITKDQVLKRNACIKEASEELWEYVCKLVDESVELGYLGI